MRNRNVQELQELAVQAQRIREDNHQMMNDVLRLAQRMQDNVALMQRIAEEAIFQAECNARREVAA